MRYGESRWSIEDHAPAKKTHTDVCCAICRKFFVVDEPIVDMKIWKCGELDYIQLAHLTCALKDND